MSELTMNEHIEALKRQLQMRAWDARRVEDAWLELLRKRPGARPSLRRGMTVGRAALAFAAAFGLMIVAFRALKPAALPTANEPRAVAAGLERVSLGDGTEMRFTRGSSVEVREQTDSLVVVGVAAGSAHFRVRHDPHRLFRVRAAEVEVDDLGTVFDVEKQGDVVRVAVTEGSVAVSFPGEGGALETATLRGGESGTYAAVASSAVVSDQALPKAGEASRVASSKEATRVAAEQASSSDWRELARAGKHRRAFELLVPAAFSDVRDEPGDLLLASDVARLSGHPDEAAKLLRKMLVGHASDPRAPSAAFTLGWVLMNELGRPRESALAFAKAEALAPRGNLAEDAVARTVEAWYRAGELSRASVEVERYRRSYPQGRHLAMLERLVGRP